MTESENLKVIQVRQQEVTNLIALSSSPLLPLKIRKRAANMAVDLLDEKVEFFSPLSTTDIAELLGEWKEAGVSQYKVLSAVHLVWGVWRNE